MSTNIARIDGSTELRNLEVCNQENLSQASNAVTILKLMMLYPMTSNLFQNKIVLMNGVYDAVGKSARIKHETNQPREFRDARSSWFNARYKSVSKF